MTRSLVTGAGGFVGANMVRALLRRGDEVHACVRPGGEISRLQDIAGNITIHEMDMTSEEQIEKVVSETKPELVFHFAHYGGNRGQNDSTSIRRVIIDGTAYLYQACMKLSTMPVIIHTGSSSEYGSKTEAMREDMVAEPTIEYGIAKLWATLYGEHLRREKKMPITTLRLFSVYGPYEAKFRLFPAVITSFLNNTLPQLSNPKTVRDFIHVDDVVEAALLATTKPAGIYNVGTAKETTLEDAVAMIQSEIGKTEKVVFGGDSGRSFDTEHWLADMTHTVKMLGWQPKIDLASGIKKTVAWFKENKKLYE